MEHCFKCADLKIDQCEMMRTMVKSLWVCAECEGKTVAMKTVLDKIENLHTEMVVIKKGQEGQKAEQERVLEGIKVVETVVKRMEGIERIQADHGERLLEQEASTRKNQEKIAETADRTSAIEKRLEKLDSDAVCVKQTNAIIRELRDIETKERNLMICNLPESSMEEAEGRKKEDEKRVCDIFAELKADQIKPVNVIRVGFKGRYPRKTLVILHSTDESEKILQNAEKTKLSNEVWISRDRTWNQREEARLFREEKQKQESAGAVPQRGRPGRPRGSKNGSVRGKGSQQDASRKRRWSGDEDDSKWSRTGNGRGRGASRGGRGGRGGGVSLANANAAKDDNPILQQIGTIASGLVTPERDTVGLPKGLSDRPGTPVPDRNSLLGAAGGSDEVF